MMFDLELTGIAGLENTKEADKAPTDLERGERTADNIRYGQNISESGMGGMTTTSTGQANHEGGRGGTEAQKDLENAENPRTAQQYSSGRNVHDNNVGG